MARPISITRDGRNIIEIYRDHAEIILEDNQRKIIGKVMIDLDDVDRCKEYRWCVSTSSSTIRYARNTSVGLLQRFLLSITDNNTIIRYIDGNTFNCRKTNLAVITKNKPEPTPEPEPISVTVAPLSPMPSPVIIYKNKSYAELVVTNKKTNDEVRIKIDLDDVDRCKDYYWGYNSSGAYNTELGLLHRHIMNAPKDKDIVFKNEDKQDCRKANLLCLTKREVHYYYEEKKQKGQQQSPIDNKPVIAKPVIESNPISTTKNPKGVADIGNGRFFVSVCNEKTGIIDDLGAFSNKEEACLAYEKRVREICEELARDAYESLVTSLMEQYYE